jgi:hypothetical protein
VHQTPRVAQGVVAYMKQFYGTEAMDSATWIAQIDAK